ncbi:unnamed protein product [Rotaria sordida]|uniref:Transmembrane protein n=1 Tax=Rotaria sordida TaxID=392033 RepID=A0A815I7N1_9BILA|nr:unnamed protein product [Rotaria sordida]CAF1608396.1 unnamed protein product [Rotaria sordida]
MDLEQTDSPQENIRSSYPTSTQSTDDGKIPVRYYQKRKSSGIGALIFLCLTRPFHFLYIHVYKNPIPWAILIGPKGRQPMGF